jgi:hypothetical protein
MNPTEKPVPVIPSASEYILDNFEPTDRIAVLVLNRDLGETVQRITSAQKAASPSSKRGFVTRTRTARTSI